MPGFKIPNQYGYEGGVPDTGVPVPSMTSDNLPIYTYTWDIGRVLGSSLYKNDERGYSEPYKIASGTEVFVERITLPRAIHLKDATLPTFTVNKETFIGSSLEYKFAKSVTWEDIKLTWYDTIGFVNHLEYWRSLVWDDSRGLHAADDYKFDTELYVYDSSFSVSNIWKLVGSWPSVIRHGDLSYTNSDAKIVDVTITYDFAFASKPWAAK